MAEEKKIKNPPKKEEQVLVINGEQLSGYNDIFIDELTNYLSEKIKLKAKRDGTDILLDIKDKKISKTRLRLFIKKFLYKKDIEDNFKIISPTGKGNSLLLKKQKES